MAKKRPDENKAMRSAEDKLARSAEVKLASDLDTLTRDANFDGPSSGGDHKVSVCYNPACADYRVERTGDKSCSCQPKRAAAAR